MGKGGGRVIRRDGEKERRGREVGRRKRETDRGESRVRQAPMVTRHSASWVGFVLHPFVRSRTRSPLVPSRPGGGGGLVGSYMGWL